MLNYGAQGENAIALYNHLDTRDQLVRHLGARADDLSPHTNKHGPCLSAVPCTSSSHPDDYRTLLSRLGGAATIAAIPPPAAPPPTDYNHIQRGDERKKHHGCWVPYSPQYHDLCQVRPRQRCVDRHQIP
jgi:hypothetical protein